LLATLVAEDQRADPEIGLEADALDTS